MTSKPVSSVILLMLPIMVEIPGGRIIYPNGIAANGVHDPILL